MFSRSAPQAIYNSIAIDYIEDDFGIKRANEFQTDIQQEFSELVKIQNRNSF